MIFRLILAVISVYMLLIFIRVLLTWFQGPAMGRPYEILTSITDPYINFFRRFKFLRIGNMDFSAILAIMVLFVVQNIVVEVYTAGTITAGIILGILLSAVWHSIAWILSFFLILVIIRLIALLIRINSTGPMLRTVDIIISPLLQFLQVKVLKGRIITFQNGLLVIGAALLLFITGGNFLIRYAAAALISLPF